MISFFRKRGGSGEIRGTQIAEYIGGRVNPQEGYEQDTCIYVKMQPPQNRPERSYLDIIDGLERVSWLLANPDIGIIVSSLPSWYYLSKKLGRTDMVLIPQHHCNFERARRPEREINTVGVVGCNGAITDPEVYRRLDILHIKNYRTRQDVVNAYQRLDIQVIWRESKNPLKNPLKIVNAASFGIPTVALQSPEYAEMEGYYYPVHSLDEMDDKVAELKRGYDPQPLIDMSESYHIENISKLYGEFL